MSESKSGTNRKRRRSLVFEIAETVVLAALIFLAVRSALQNFKVEGQSMEPGFHNSEFILVSKLDYLLHSPARGDVVVFRATPAGQPNVDFIKRVVALPGETVAVHDGSVFINGRRLPETYIRQRPDYSIETKRVPKNDYFVLGDNRNQSFDSSKWPSMWLPREDIIGKARIGYWPLSDLSVFGMPGVIHA